MCICIRVCICIQKAKEEHWMTMSLTSIPALGYHQSTVRARSLPVSLSLPPPHPAPARPPPSPHAPVLPFHHALSRALSLFLLLTLRATPSPPYTLDHTLIIL